MIVYKCCTGANVTHSCFQLALLNFVCLWTPNLQSTIVISIACSLITCEMARPPFHDCTTFQSLTPQLSTSACSILVVLILLIPQSLRTPGYKPSVHSNLRIPRKSALSTSTHSNRNTQDMQNGCCVLEWTTTRGRNQGHSCACERLFMDDHFP